MQIGGESRTCFACLATSPNRRSNLGCSSWIIRKFFVMIPSSRHYRESIFIHYLYVTFYTCSFPHNNIHTYIMYIFRVSISMCKCSYDSILLYTIHVKVYYYCLTLNCYCPISNCYCLTLNYYCLTLNCYCLDIWTVTVYTLNCYCLDIWTVTVYTLNYYYPTVIV